MTEKTIQRRDFEIYRQGLERLEQFEKDLVAMKAESKFPLEVMSIRSKLKHVSEIPNIERGLKTLKNKIAGKYKPKRRVNKTSKKIEELEKKIEEKSRKIKDVPGEKLEFTKAWENMPDPANNPVKNPAELPKTLLPKM